MFAPVLVFPSAAICTKCGYLLAQSRTHARRERFVLLECATPRCSMRGKQLKFPLTTVMCKRV